MMRYYSCYEYSPDPESDPNASIATFSEEEILKEYWDYWYERMCKKYGKETVDEKYTKQDCIEDWVVVNWAWESKNETKIS